MTEKSTEEILKVTNRIEELVRVTDFLEDLGSLWSLSPSLVLSLNLVLEEALSNTIFYGFDDEKEHWITLSVHKEGNILSITLTDDGHEYDPTQKPDPDITLPLEKRPVGGLGILFIKKIMDSVTYQRKENKNYLTLTKQI